MQTWLSPTSRGDRPLVGQTAARKASCDADGMALGKPLQGRLDGLTSPDSSHQEPKHRVGIWPKFCGVHIDASFLMRHADASCSFAGVV